MAKITITCFIHLCKDQNIKAIKIPRIAVAATVAIVLLLVTTCSARQNLFLTTYTPIFIYDNIHLWQYLFMTIFVYDFFYDNIYLWQYLFMPTDNSEKLWFRKKIFVKYCLYITYLYNNVVNIAQWQLNDFTKQLF